MLKSGKINNFFIFLCTVSWFVSSLCLADTPEVTVQRVELESRHEYCVLNAEIGYQLSQTARSALKSGIPLSWNLQFKVQRQRPLWNKTVFDRTAHFQIRYYPLLNVYHLSEPGNTEGSKFSSLSSALAAMGVVRDAIEFRKDLLKPDYQYQWFLKVHFDREALPLPLRPEAYYKTSWSLSSDWLTGAFSANSCSE